MIKEVYTNSTDEGLYATLEAALHAYRHMIKDGKIVPNEFANAGIWKDRYTYIGSDNFFNGANKNGRLEFEVGPLDGPKKTVYIGYSKLIGAEAAMKREQNLRERIAMAAMNALPRQAYGALRDRATAAMISESIDEIEEEMKKREVFSQASKDFLAFLKISRELMGRYSDEEEAFAKEWEGE